MAASLVSAIPWSSPDLIPQPLPTLSADAKKQIKKALGGEAPPHVVAISQVPWLLRLQLDTAFGPLAFLPRDIADLVAVVVSQDNSCRHCYGSMRMLLRMFGYSEEQVRQLEADLHQTDFPASTREALEFARMLSRANPRPGKDQLERLASAGLSREVITELAVCAANWTLGNRMATMLALAPDPIEALGEKWYAPVVALMARLMLGSKRKHVPAKPMPPEYRGGPFAPLVDRLDGIPLGVSIAGALKQSLESDILPRRTKLLIMAVISRTVACPMCESGAEHLLAAEGFSPEKTQVVLKNLASAELTPLESRLIPLARETVRYQPQQLQEKLRTVQQELTAPQFLEFIGVVALANAAARLTVILHAQ